MEAANKIDMEMVNGIDWKYLFLSFEGRIDRKPYWIGLGALFAAGLALGIVNSIVAMILPPVALVISAFFLVLLYPAAALAAKRWHDRGKSGWWSLVAMIPVLGVLYALWELAIQKGVDEANEYGDKPAGLASL